MRRINYLKEITTVLRLQCKKFSVAKLVMLIALLASTQSMYAQVYFHDFGTTNITTKPYTGVPTTLDANLSNSSWTTTATAFAGFAGSTGASLSLATFTGTNSITLTFNVASGKKLSITSFNLWRVRSTNGPATISIYINGTQVGNNIAVPTSGAALGVTNVSTAISNLTGTITVQVFTSSATGGTFRIDDFTLNGTVSSVATPTVSTTGTLAAVNTTYGSGSASPSSFNVSGANMSAGITATAPTGYQVSLASGSGYASSVTVGAAGTIASTPVYVRLSPTATVAGSPYSGNVVLTSTGATSVNVATVSSTVSTKELTISGLSANNKLFDGTTTAILSGTPSLVGIVNSDVVTLGGTYVANFASSAVATGIAVSVTGYTISGAGSSNYTLTQPSFTADITSAPSPIISSALTASGTYGVAITNYTITASETPTSFTATGLPTGLSVNTSTGVISGTPSVVGSYNVTISATNIGGTGSATLAYTISPKNLTVNGSSADSKVYDRTTTATISGSTLVGIVGADVVTLSNAGTFASATVANGTVVTSNQTLGGTDAAKYTVTLPSSLTANITQKALTISGAAASNKLFDGTNTATLTGTLNGVISPDTVTLTLSGTFASSAVGTGIAVTSTSTIGGVHASNYSLTQPTLTSNIIGDTTLLRWNTFGNTGNETTEPSTSNSANIAAATLNYTGSTVTTTGNSNRFGATNWAVGALSTTKYIQFTVTPNLGYSCTPTSFSFIWDFSTTGPKSVALRSSVDGYTANLGSLTNMTTSTSTVKTITIAGLSGLTTATTFRLYGYDATATGGTGGFDCAVSTNNVNLYGTTTSTGPIPTISTIGTLAALSTTYGTASTTSTFNVSGVDMTTGITVTAPTGFEVSGNSSTGFGSTATIGAAGTISSKPVYVRLSSTASVAGSPYSGDIVLSTTGGANVNIATVSSTVSSLTVTATGATASNKIYDGNATATITGASIASANGDTISVTGGGTFSNKNVGTGKSITANLSLSGTNAANYTLTQPTLTANITAKALTITSPVAQNKIFDNNATASITGTLSGVISPEVVTLNGTGTFASSAVGNGIAVTSTSTIGGADAGNYSLTQPTGLTADITPAGLTPQTITFALSSPVTYGVAPIVLGGTTTSPLTVTYTSSNPAVASVSNNTLTILSNGSVTITASQAGDGTTYEPAVDVLQNLTINQKVLTLQNALGQNKVYDRTNTATFTGSLNSIEGYDVVTSINVGTFSQTAIGTGLTITPSATLSGPDAGKYTLTQPTGLLANITPKELTLLTPVAQNKIVDGTNTATITGTLNGVISPDAVSVTLSATFASSAVGTGIAVTSTSILAGLDAGNYTLTQPTGLTANINAQPTMVEDIMPQYIQGTSGTNSNRLPYVFRATINNLLPNATYRYYNLADSVNGPIANSAGILLLPSASGSFTSVSSPGMITAGTYGTLTANASGSYTGWFIMQTSGNGRFAAGKELNMKIFLNDGAGGTAIATRLVSTNTVKVINLGTTSTATLGSGLRGNSNAVAKNMVFAYDNMNGTGRPIAGSYVESAGLTLTSTATFYTTSVQGVAGAYGMIIPNVNANGIRLIQQLDYATAALIGCGKDADGIWAGGANTVNPITGTTAKVLTATDAPLNICCTPTTSTTNTSICAASLPYSWNAQSITTAGTFTFSTTNAGGCDSTATLNLSVNQATSSTTNTAICAASLPFSWNGQSLSTAGTYTNTQAGANGCDSVATLNLTVKQPTSSTTNTKICAAALPYSWNGQSLTVAGTYTNTQAGANGCDSVTTINLTVNQPTSSTTNTSICAAALPYSWNGQTLTGAGTYTNTQVGANSCDSVATLNLTVKQASTGSATLSGPSPFSWNGGTYTATGIYTYTTTNAVGCDSVVTLNLTIGASTATVNLVTFIQGYYNGAGMAAARYDNLTGSGSATPGNATDVDFVTVELHDAATPSTVSYTKTGLLQTNGTLSVTFPGAAVGNSYYIVLKHQNSLQLWSANPVTISSTTSYNFSTSLTQAYTDGSSIDPMALLATGVYGMYSGDINQDEYIDGSDYSVYEADVDNSNNLGLFSLPSDLNGDTYVDGSDYPVFDINSANNLYAQHP